MGMKHVFFMVLCAASAATLVTGGCVSVPYISPPRSQQTSLTFYLDITSEPPDAEIYVNNVLYGRTPAASLPLTVTCSNRKDWFEETTTVLNQYVLMVVKNGYRRAAEPIEFSYSWEGAHQEEYRPKLKKQKFHFELEKDE